MFSYQNANNFTQNMSATGNYTDNLWDQCCYYQDQLQSYNQVSPQDGYYMPECYFSQDKTRPNVPPSTSEREYDIVPYNVSPPSNTMELDENVAVQVPYSYSFPKFPVLQYSPLTPEPVLPSNSFVPNPRSNNYMKATKPRTQISLVSTSGGNYKAIIKRTKRKRTTFTTEQIAALEKYFSKRPYITREQRQVLVEELQLSDKSIKIWFQNRRLKGKKAPERTDFEEAVISNSYSEERITSDFRLDIMQSEIMKKTDDHGFVNLDDGVMDDLVDVIDKFLTNNDQVINSVESNGSESSPIYEPISPASNSNASNDENNSSPWKPSEPNESLQRLFDLQTMFSF